jgi:hypothetical protein
MTVFHFQVPSTPKGVCLPGKLLLPASPQAQASNETQDPIVTKSNQLIRSPAAGLKFLANTDTNDYV